MQRKDFLLTTLAAIPLAALSQNAKHDAVIKPFKVNAGQSRNGEVILYKGLHPNDVKVSGKDTGGQLAIFEYTGLAKIGPSLHLHYNQDETFYVIHGQYRFVVGQETFELKAGDTIFLPRKVPHTWIQLSNEGKMLYTLQPAGNMEAFFSAMNKLTKPLTLAESERVHQDYGMKLLGAGLTL